MSLWGSSKKITAHELYRLLDQISALRPSKREYIQGFFARYRSGGISKFEVERALRDLQSDSSDDIGSSEIELVRQKLLEHFDE